MDRKNSFYSFQLYNNQVFDYQVNSIACVKSDTIVNDWQGDLRAYIEFPFLEFMHQTDLIRTFQHSSSKRAVNLHS